jgi:hypothetical protein
LSPETVKLKVHLIQ